MDDPAIGAVSRKSQSYVSSNDDVLDFRGPFRSQNDGGLFAIIESPKAGVSLGYKDCRALESAGAQVGQGLIGVLEGVGRGPRFNADLLREW